MPLILFVTSITLAFILIIKRFNIALALGVALLIYSTPLLGLDVIEISVRTFNRTLFETVFSLMLAMFVADLYRSTYAAESVVRSLESLSPRTAAISIPAIVGLLPMPAGAYVSATIINPLYVKCRLSSDERTFLNYWFRHIWIVVWPLYQSVVLASAILNTSFYAILLHNWPIFVAAILGGGIASKPILQKINSGCIESRERNLKGLVHLWLFVVVIVTILLLKLPLPLVLFIIAILLILVYRPSVNMIKNGLRYSLDPTIIALIVESMIFSRVAAETKLAYQLAEYLVPYADIAVFLIPFLMVIVTGFEFTFVTIAFPSLLPLLTGHRATLAFLGGYAGAMLSPAHACFALSAKFFKSNLWDVYKKHLILATVISILIAVAMLMVTSSAIF
ncbi:MAG: DUF401 family protein [Ignisphaera sp.]|nr:DUF401 family protein [Ignisphaera sp.]